MALYTYRKEQITSSKRLAQFASYASITIGSLLLFWSFYPILSFWIYSRLFIQADVRSPVPHSAIASSLKEASAVINSNEVFSSNLRDFVHANLWFPAKPQTAVPQNVSVKAYTLSIPKLNIIDAKVTVGGDDLSKSLVHYLPTTLPGESGNVAIFGHSTLPQLFNVKDYKTIFTYLPSLEKGDTINVTVAGQKYTYEVFDMFVVNPDQVSILEQKYDNSYLTLVTCVPPGTFWNRLVVQAKLKDVTYGLQ